MEGGPGATSILVLLCCVALGETYSMVEFMSYSCKVRCETVERGEDDVNTRLDQQSQKLDHLSQKLDQTVKDLAEAQQRQLETEKQWNVTETRLLVAEKDLNKTKELLNTDVAFTATLPFAPTPLVGGVRVVYSTIISNIGDAYNDNTGIFTAPFNGTYSFAVTTMPSNDGGHHTTLTVNGEAQCTAYSPTATVSGTCVFNKKLMAGDRVWADNPHNTTYHYNLNIFSGNLVHREY